MSIVMSPMLETRKSPKRSQSTIEKLQDINNSSRIPKSPSRVGKSFNDLSSVSPLTLRSPRGPLLLQSQSPRELPSPKVAHKLRKSSPYISPGHSGKASPIRTPTKLTPRGNLTRRLLNSASKINEEPPVENSPLVSDKRKSIGAFFKKVPNIPLINDSQIPPKFKTSFASDDDENDTVAWMELINADNIQKKHSDKSIEVTEVEQFGMILKNKDSFKGDENSGIITDHTIGNFFKPKIISSNFESDYLPEKVNISSPVSSSGGVAWGMAANRSFESPIGISVGFGGSAFSSNQTFASENESYEKIYPQVDDIVEMQDVIFSNEKMNSSDADNQDLTEFSTENFYPSMHQGYVPQEQIELSQVHEIIEIPIVSIQNYESHQLQFSDDTVDLMDEHLSVVDGSFSEEEKDNFLSVDQFLDLVGLNFEKNLATKFVRETMEFSFREFDESEYIKAAIVNKPIILSLELACEEMSERIQESKAFLAEKQSENIATQPLYLDFGYGTGEDKEKIMESLRATKIFARFNAKFTWYDYKYQLMKSLQADFDIGFNALQDDLRILDHFKQRLQEYIVLMRKYRADLIEEQQGLLTKEKMLKSSKEVRINKLRDLIKQEQLVTFPVVILMKMSSIIQEQENVEKKTKDLRQEYITIEKEKKENEGGIQRALITQSNHAIAEPAKISAMRDLFSMIITTHKFVPSKFSETGCTWVFDNNFKISFEEDSSAKNAIVILLQVEVIELNLDNNGDDDSSACLVAFGSENVVKWLKGTGKCLGFYGIQSNTDRIIRLWECLKDLLRDINEARMTCPISIMQDLKENDKIVIQVIFFEPTIPRRFLVYFSIDNECCEKYFSGGFDWRFKSVIGEF
ncbi:hypothetical protein HK096_001529, partial [Nowakowskiella sp. JEL0078]